MTTPPASGQDNFHRSRTTFASYGLVGVFAYLEASLGPILPFLRREHHFGFTTASLHFSAFAAGGLVTGFVADRLAARLGRARCLWGGAVGMALAAAGIGLSPGPAWSTVVAFIMGMFGVLVLIMTQSILADAHGSWRTVAISESNAAASGFAMVSSLAVGAAASTALGWRAALALPAVAVAALFLLFRSEPVGGAKRLSPSSGEHRALPRLFWIYCAVLFLGVAAEWCIGYWGAEFLSASLDISPAGAASATSLFFVAMLAGRALTSRIARRVDDPTILVASLSLALLGFLVAWVARDRAPGLAGLFVTGLGLSSVYPVGLSAGVGVVPHATDTASARLGISGGAAILLLPFAVGRLADAVGIVRSFGTVAVLLACAVCLAALGRRSSRPAR